MIYLSYFRHSDLFHMLRGKEGFDAVMTAARQARYPVTTIVVNASCRDADLKPAELRVTIACMADDSISAEQAEAIEKAAVAFLTELGQIGGPETGPRFGASHEAKEAEPRVPDSRMYATD
jgi:hypothetical protein